MHAHVAQDALDRMVAQVAVAAVQLQAAIDHLEAGVGGKRLACAASRVAAGSPSPTATAARCSSKRAASISVA